MGADRLSVYCADTTDCESVTRNVGKMDDGANIVGSFLVCKSPDGPRVFVIQGIVYDPEEVVREKGWK